MVDSLEGSIGVVVVSLARCRARFQFHRLGTSHGLVLVGNVLVVVNIVVLVIHRPFVILNASPPSFGRL